MCRSRENSVVIDIKVRTVMFIKTIGGANIEAMVASVQRYVIFDVERNQRRVSRNCEIIVEGFTRLIGLQKIMKMMVKTRNLLKACICIIWLKYACN